MMLVFKLYIPVLKLDQMVSEVAIETFKKLHNSTPTPCVKQGVGEHLISDYRVGMKKVRFEK